MHMCKTVSECRLGQPHHKNMPETVSELHSAISNVNHVWWPILIVKLI